MAPSSSVWTAVLLSSTVVTAFLPRATPLQGYRGPNRVALAYSPPSGSESWDDDIKAIAGRYLNAKYRACDSEGGNCRALCDRSEVRTLLREILPPVSEGELEAELENVMAAFNDEDFIDISDFVGVVIRNKFWEEAGELVVKELMYLDCIQCSYGDVSCQPLLENDDYDELKDSLTWDGSAIATMSGKEAKFLHSVSNSRKGVPSLSDEQYAKLKGELQAEGSWVVKRAQDPLERLGMNTLMGYVHRSFKR